MNATESSATATMDMPNYQALITLNNAGAILLQRHCYDEAYITLVDALSVLENESMATTEQYGRPIGNSSLQAMVACAAMRLERTGTNLLAGFCGSMSTSRPITSSSPSPPLIGSCTGHRGPSISFWEHKVLLQESIFLHSPRPCASETHTDLASSVIVYNFALCHLKMSIYTQTERQYFRQSGIDLLKQAYATLPDLPSFTDFDDFTSIVTMAVITLTFMLQVGSLSVQESLDFTEDLRLAKDGLAFCGKLISQTAAAAA